MNDGFNILISKLDKFIRKYYKNLLIRGGILSVSLLLAVYLSVVSLEYFGRFSISTRTALFYVTIGVSMFVFVRYILLPLLGLLKIGKTISRKQASEIISQHFPEIKDKLFNTIELHKMEDNSYSQDLILASISQRISELKPIPFVSAINFKANYKFLKYLAVVIVIFASTIAVRPSLINEGSERIINHRKFYQKPAPFSFSVLNDSLVVEKGNDYVLDIGVSGEYVPEQVYISIRGNKIMMKKISNIQYQYEFKSLNNSVDFFISAADVSSEEYNLNVLPSPIIINFLLSVDAPSYTGVSDEILENIGDITVPEGTKLKWEFSTKDIDKLSLDFGGDTIICPQNPETKSFEYSNTFKKSSKYSISTSNEFVDKPDMLKYFVNIIPDIYPDVSVVSVRDSIKPFIYYFIGNVADDYGFSSLTFNYTIEDVIDTTISIPVSKNSITDKFFYAYDFSTLMTGKDEKIEYYFEVSDNDKVNGHKSSRSNLFVYKLPSEEQMDSLRDDSSDKMEKLMKESMKIAKQLKKDVKKLKEEKIKNEMSDWEQSKLIEDIINKEQSLEELLNQLSEENQLKNEMENTVSEQQKDIMEKQEMLQELLDQLLTDELKDLIEELKKLQEEMKPEDMEELTEDLDLSLDDLQDQLDRNLEMLKKYEMEQKINKQIEELKELAKEQEELAKKAEDKKSDADSLASEQNKQKEKFEKLMEEYEELKKEDQKLENPMGLDDFKQDKKEITENFEKDQKSLEKGSKKKASKGQKGNSKKLEKLSDDMQKMMDSAGSEQAMEDMEDLQQIIENLITFSFDQERIMLGMNSMSANDPLINDFIEEQNKIEDDFVIIDDSITSLAMRVPQISALVNKELVAVEKKMLRINNAIEEIQINNIVKEQQFVMTSANNLALLLSEAMEAMQKQMSQMKSGEQQCEKQGQGSPSMSQMKGMQKSLKQQLEGMLDEMKKGKGDKSKMGQDAMNKRLGEMLAQQEIFRQMLKEMGTKSGIKPGTQKLLNEINKMVKDNEKDLANKRIAPALLERQKLILSRLLEAEKSENKREIEKKRESNENRYELLSNPEELINLDKEKENFNELFDKKNITLKSYYSKKYKKYLEFLKENE